MVSYNSSAFCQQKEVIELIFSDMKFANLVYL